jgi:hypothetical protein
VRLQTEILILRGIKRLLFHQLHPMAIHRDKEQRKKWTRLIAKMQTHETMLEREAKLNDDAKKHSR